MTDTVPEAIEEGGLAVQLATDRQERFVEELVNTGSIDDAAKLAAYSDHAAGEMAVRREPVQRAVKECVVRKIKTEGLALAYRTTKNLMKNGNPPAVQLGAAKLMFALNGMGDGKGEDDRDKPLAEMTEAELERFMRKAQRVIEQGGNPPLLRVTPGDGA